MSVESNKRHAWLSWVFVVVLAVFRNRKGIGRADGRSLLGDELRDVLRFPKQFAGKRGLDFQPSVIDGFSEIGGFGDRRIEHEVDLRFRDERGGGNNQPWSCGGGHGDGQDRREGGDERFHEQVA